MTISSLEAALGYARLGWRVLPILADSKAPATEHGVHDGTAGLLALTCPCRADARVPSVRNCGGFRACIDGARVPEWWGVDEYLVYDLAWVLGAGNLLGYL